MSKTKLILTLPRDWTVYLCAGFLAVLYLAGWTALQIHSSADHHATGESCAETVQSDACHARIYHGMRSDDCRHTAHLFESVRDCRVCDIMVFPNQVTTHDGESQDSPGIHSELLSTGTADPIAGYDFPLSLRGPPVTA